MVNHFAWSLRLSVRTTRLWRALTKYDAFSLSDLPIDFLVVYGSLSPGNWIPLQITITTLTRLIVKHPALKAKQEKSVMSFAAIARFMKITEVAHEEYYVDQANDWGTAEHEADSCRLGLPSPLWKVPWENDQGSRGFLSSEEFLDIINRGVPMRVVEIYKERGQLPRGQSTIWRE